MAEDKNGAAPKNGRLKFDFSTVTAFEVDEMMKTFRVADIRQHAALIARFCSACPPEWGDPKDPDTFGKRPWFGEDNWLSVKEAFLAAFADPAKN